MKQKSLSILLVIALMFTLSACSSSASDSPEKTVQAFCDATKSFDIKTIMTQVDGENPDDADFDSLMDAEGMPDAMMDYLKSSASKMTYTIKETNVDGDTATAVVEFKYIDSTPMMQTVLQKVMEKALSGETEMTDEVMNELFGDAIEEYVSESEATFIEATVDVALIKTDAGWKIKELNEDLVNVIVANFLNAASSLGGM